MSTGFIEVETPMLGRSTPEGARDYLVPSRVQQGSFYALPQSPQLYKQILMVAGYDRYMQVARCFRDEDLRADRQPEFTQLDLEMSFITADDIMGDDRRGRGPAGQEFLGIDLPLPLPRMTYDDAMERFGHDAPDLRFGMELVDVTDLARECGFPRVSRSGPLGRAGPRAERQGRGRSLFAQGDRRTHRLRGRGFRRQGAGLVQGRSRRHAGLADRQEFQRRAVGPDRPRGSRPEPGDLLLLVADRFEVTCKALYALRKRLAGELKLYQPGQMHFSWVVEFPMFAPDEETGGWTAMHHPFTAPRPQDLPLLATDRASAGPGLRPGAQRLRGRRRHDPDPRSAVAAAGLRAVGH